MKQRRLFVLLTAMAALLALRWWVPPKTPGAPEVAAAVERPVTPAKADLPPLATAADVAVPDDPAAGTRDPDQEEPGNAFAVRGPASPVQPPVQAATPLPKAFVGPPLPPPPPPPPQPPFSVIGSWRDEQGPSVFLAGARGVLQGRVGDLLDTEYRIVQITPQKVSLKHLRTNADVSLAVPAGSASTLSTASK